MRQLGQAARDRRPRPRSVRAGVSPPGVDGATGIVVVSLSGALSATMQSAQLAARSIEEDPAIELDVRVLDSRSISMGLGTIALACARLAADGASIDDVEAHAVELIDRTRVFGALDTLENLKKGGRIGNAKALLATALSIKPIIEVTGGVVEQGGKQRTRSKALAFLVEKVKSYDGAIENLAVLHADCSDVDMFVDMLRPYAPDEIVVGEIGPVIGTHGGRGTIGVAFQVTGQARSASRQSRRGIDVDRSPGVVPRPNHRPCCRSFIALTGERRPTSVPAASCPQRPLPRLPP